MIPPLPPVRQLLKVPLVFSALAISFLSQGSRGQRNGVTLLDHLDQPHGVSGQGTSYSSCWGWVSPTGKEFALIATATGTSIIDLNVSPIREVQFIPGPTAPYAYREFKTYKQYAYAVSEGGSGVQIIDLSGLPDTAVLVRSFIYVSTTPPDSGKNNVRSHTVTLADGYLYCNGSANWPPGGCVIFSLHNDPTSPEFAGTFEPQYIHDSYVRNDTLYASAIYPGGGLYVVNIQKKNVPATMGVIVYSGSGTHNAWATIDGKFALTCDEIGSTPHDLKIWALDSLPNSVKVAEWVAEPTSNIHNVHGRGYYAYIAHYTAGMRVVDVHDPYNPFEAGSYDTYPGPSGGYAGCWGVYPYFFSGRWIGSDMQTGLYLCSFDSLKPRVRSSLLGPADQSVVNASTTFLWQRATDPSVDPHYYEIHIAGAGIDTSLRAADSSLTPSLRDILPHTGVYSWFVMIRDEFTEVSSADTFHFTYTGPVGVQESGRTRDFSLAQNYPNPFNPTTRIDFSLPSAARVRLTIYDLLGRAVSRPIDGAYQPGSYQILVNASSLPSGTYFYELVTPSFTRVRKMILSK